MAETVERFTSKDGTQVACFVTGSGPPLLPCARVMPAAVRPRGV